eukprot:gnl/Spiro4/9534_TR5052_c0_g1_i1.p1 gnl/Spiro4/9534_TR5052_c0_g1~~gnl/Spiro4/9534_TR5052_c0_g1_i1.p1  ORF type:complete len:379 (-),score=68.91 gnl/Spiro4/9534_TR5052_c0_g1_i1:77-1171(-)
MLLARQLFRSAYRSFTTVSDARGHKSEFSVVDVRTLVPQHPGRRTSLATIRRALVDQGGFYAAGVESMPTSYISYVYEFLKKAHSLPLEVKRQYAAPEGGYSGGDLGSEFAELAYEANTKSSVRGWDYSRTRFTGNNAAGAGGSGKAANSYPNLPNFDFASLCDELYERQNPLGELLLTAFADMFNLPSDTFSRSYASGDLGTVRLLHYPGRVGADGSVVEEDANIGISAHTDFEAFTLMHQDASGLQLLTREGLWLDAPVHHTNFIVIVGDVLERFTNGELRATPHRVLRTQHPRNSIIRFNAVHPDTLISPLPQFCSPEKPAGYTPVTMSRHMKTTMDNLRAGKGAWDPVRNVSISANYVYN